MPLSLLKHTRSFIGISLKTVVSQLRNASTLSSGKSPSPLVACLRANDASIPNTSLAYDQRRHYAMRQPLKDYGIVWRRPNYVPSWSPEKSGDFETHSPPEETKPRLELLVAKDVFDATDAMTKRYLSVKMVSNRDALKVVRYEKLRKIQRHKFDTGSAESTIAMLTVKIRNQQEEYSKNKKNIALKRDMIELIARRKKLLKHLRRMDYKRFEWLLEELNLEYKPFPIAYHWITRKDSLRKLVQLKKEEIVNEHMEVYKKYLEDQEEDFLKEKKETLEWIAKTEAELGISSNSDAVNPTVSK